MAAQVQHLSPLELAEGLVTSKRGLQRGAAAEAASSAEQRDAAERRYAASQVVHASAQHASSRAPDDEALLAALTIATARLERDGSIRDAASATHESAKESLSRLDAGLAAAEGALERVTIETKLSDPARLDDARAQGRRFIDLIADLADLLHEEEASIAEENAMVAHARALGSTVAEGDGLPYAVGLAEGLLARGHDGSGYAQPAELRWALAPRQDAVATSPWGRPQESGITGLVRLVSAVMARPSTMHGTDALRRELATWHGHRSYAAASRTQHERAEGVRLAQPEPFHVVKERERLTARGNAPPVGGVSEHQARLLAQMDARTVGHQGGNGSVFDIFKRS